MLGMRDQGVWDWAVLAGLGVEGEHRLSLTSEASAEKSMVATATNPCAKETLAFMPALGLTRENNNPNSNYLHE